MEEKQLIKQLFEQGFSSRKIAKQINKSKSYVNYVLHGRKPTKNKYATEVILNKPKVLVLDVETSADIVATFGRRNVNIGQQSIIREGNELISAAWSWVGEDKVNSFYTYWDKFEIDASSEKFLLYRLLEAIEQADAVVIHNARFDLGTIQQRLLHYGMGRLPSVKVIDTLMIARKYLQLRSNKLDSITKYFGLSNKLENEGIKLWIATQSGDKVAILRMLDYNEQDVVALKAVYNKFVPLNQGFNQGLIVQTDKPVCSNCGSTEVIKTGRHVNTLVSSYEEYSCNCCGSKLRSRTNVLPKQVRQNLLIAL